MQNSKTVQKNEKSVDKWLVEQYPGDKTESETADKTYQKTEYDVLVDLSHAHVLHLSPLVSVSDAAQDTSHR